MLNTTISCDSGLYKEMTFFLDGIPADLAVVEVRNEFKNNRVYHKQER
jgi:hypothetical protein